MKRLAIIFLIFVSPLFATTTLRLHLAGAGVSGYQGMSLALGPFGNTIQTSVTYTTASGTHIQATNTGGGSALAWMSEPFSGSVTMSGTETMNFYGKEAAAANNASVEFDLYKYSGGSLGSAFCTGVWGTELTTSIATHAPTCAATSTSFSAGDQLVVKLFIVNCATSGCPTGTMGAGSPGVTIDYDGPTSGSDGDTNLSTAETITFTPVGGSGGTPSCSRMNDETEPFNGGFTAPGTTVFEIPDYGASSGNAIIVGVSGSAGDVITISDNNSDTFYLGAHEADGTNGQDVWLFYATNVASGPTQITMSHSTTDAWTTVWSMECTNVALATPLDSSAGGAANSNTVSVTLPAPHYSGDLLIQWFWNDWISNAFETSISPGSQGNITWQLAAQDRAVAMGTQWGVYSTNTSFSPTMSTTGDAGFASAVMALRSSSAGTAFPSTGIRVAAIKEYWFNTAIANMTSLPRTEQLSCPSGTNGLVLEWLGGAGASLGTITDSNSNTWTSTGSAVCNSGGGCSQSYYAQNPTITNTMSVTFGAGTPVADSAKLYCVSGASTTHFFDKTATTTGAQAAAGPITATSLITPSTANGLVFSSLGVANNTMNGVTSPSGAINMQCLWNQQTVGNGGCDQNNGWGVYPNPTTGALTWTFTEWNGSTAAGDWVERADAFEAPSGASVVRHRASVIQQ